MGRTLPTFRQLIDDAIARWSKFRRALRREDQEYFDRLFRRVHSYTQAATYQASDNPMEAILLSIALDQEKRLDVLERVVLPPEPGSGSTWSPPGESLDSTLTLDALPHSEPVSLPETTLEQLDVPRSPDQNNHPNTHPQPNPGQPRDTRRRPHPPDQHHTTPWLDFRSLPEPSRDEPVADRPEPETPPSD